MAKSKQEQNSELEFTVVKDRNDKSTRVQIQQVKNGFIVRTGKAPVFFETISLAATAIAKGLELLDWNKDE
jgi:hypothetical protein